MKKAIKIIMTSMIILISIIIFISIILIGLFIYSIKFKISDVSKYENEQNNYTILFQAIGEPEWPFGSTKVKVTLLNSNGKKVESFQADIHNDGGTADERNIDVNWQNSYVEVTLKGDEQEDDIHKMNY